MPLADDKANSLAFAERHVAVAWRVSSEVDWRVRLVGIHELERGHGVASVSPAREVLRRPEDRRRWEHEVGRHRTFRCHVSYWSRLDGGSRHHKTAGENVYDSYYTSANSAMASNYDKVYSLLPPTRQPCTWKISGLFSHLTGSADFTPRLPPVSESGSSNACGAALEGGMATQTVQVAREQPCLQREVLQALSTPARTQARMAKTLESRDFDSCKGIHI